MEIGARDAVSNSRVPNGWRLVRLGDVAEVVTGSTPPREISKYYGGNIPWVKPSDLALGRLVGSSEESLTEAGVGVSRQVPENSVLVSCIGTIGEVAISKMPLCFNQQINALIPGTEILPQFLYWACNHQASYLLSISAKTAVPILNKTAFSAVPIPLPPLSEQRAIAAVLDSIDQAIEGADAVIAATEQLRDSLLHQLLTRGVPGWHTEWKEAPGVGTMPADWNVARLGDVAEVVTGSTPPREISEYYGGNVPWVKPSDLALGRLVGSSEESLTEAGVEVSSQVPENSVLVSCIGTIGEVAISKMPLCFNQQINALIHGAEILPQFLYWACSHQASYLRSISAKTAVPILNKTAFSAVPIPLSPLPEQQAIAAMLDGVDEAIEQGKNEKNMLKCLKDSTADALLTGRVRVRGSDE